MPSSCSPGHTGWGWAVPEETSPGPEGQVGGGGRTEPAPAATQAVGRFLGRCLHPSLGRQRPLTSGKRWPPRTLGSGLGPTKLSVTWDRGTAGVPLGDPPTGLIQRHNLKGKSGASISDILMQNAGLPFSKAHPGVSAAPRETPGSTCVPETPAGPGRGGAWGRGPRG